MTVLILPFPSWGSWGKVVFLYPQLHIFQLPEYLPPLLRLMKQRMSRMRSKRMIALTKAMNQPSEAKLPVVETRTGPEGTAWEGDKVQTLG